MRCLIEREKGVVVRKENAVNASGSMECLAPIYIFLQYYRNQIQFPPYNANMFVLDNVNLDHFQGIHIIYYLSFDMKNYFLLSLSRDSYNTQFFTSFEQLLKNIFRLYKYLYITYIIHAAILIQMFFFRDAVDLDQFYGVPIVHAWRIDLIYYY